MEEKIRLILIECGSERDWGSTFREEEAIKRIVRLVEDKPVRTIAPSNKLRGIKPHER